MGKSLVFIFLLCFFVSCNENCQNQSAEVQEQNANCPIPTPDPDPDPIPDGDVPNEALTFDVNYVLTNFDRGSEDKLLKAIEIIKKVIGSNEFRSKVLNFTFQGKKQFFENKGLSNEEIYQKLLDGREDLKPDVDNQMDLELELYYSWTSTVGYTTPGAMKIYLNSKFYNPFTPSEVAGNVFHEWTHKLGFEHATNYSKERDSTVPYAIGYLIRDLGRQYE
jgi:hypothetical protein